MPSFLTEEEIRQLEGWRRDFHAHPELAYQESRTAELAAAHLRSCGYEVSTGVGQTGVVGLLKGGAPGRTVMLRADMDCLPLTEENDVPYRSQHAGRMHACGHDGHTAALMSVARKLGAMMGSLKGAVKIVFQPAEEGGNGAERMIRDGVLSNPDVDAAFGLHVWNDQPVGKIALNPGALMAGVDSFEVTIRGKGGHGAAPHQAVDAVVAAAHVISQLQTVVSRNVDPLDTAVVTVGAVHAGDAFNIIPETAFLRGTVRYFNPKLGDSLPEWIERVVRGTTDSMGAGYEMKYERLTPPTINNSGMAEFVRSVAAELVGAENVIFDARTMGGEDMSFFLNEVPGCYYFVGSRNEQRGLIHPHHSPRFDFDERALEIGVEMTCRIVQKFLS